MSNRLESEASPSEDVGHPGFGRRRSDGIGKTSAPARKTAVTGETAASNFKTLAQSERRKELFVDFIEPEAIEPTVLLRSVSILRNCDLNLVPTLDGGEQLKGFAHTMVRDEIASQSELLVRLREGTQP